MALEEVHVEKVAYGSYNGHRHVIHIMILVNQLGEISTDEIEDIQWHVEANLHPL